MIDKKEMQRRADQGCCPHCGACSDEQSVLAWVSTGHAPRILEASDELVAACGDCGKEWRAFYACYDSVLDIMVARPMGPDEDY